MFKPQEPKVTATKTLQKKRKIRTCVPDATEVFADPHKLRGRHADDGLVLRIRDAEVLAVDVHQLHLEIRNLILFYSSTPKCYIPGPLKETPPRRTRMVKRDWALTGRLEHEGDGVGTVVGLDSDDVVVAGAAEHLGHVVEVHAHGEVAVAAIVLEALGA